ncbi:histidyl-tRNA synthetase, putative [Babesia ovata]|uniref:Histidyl-tRNA synthetase, putative n=1 Tax=Babesia ovata TaxID=189622 RepID=A0A2H6KA99_9APIC|nr:histidyl-tRNA synthetase, putative [Babesia ovata]GBE59924.1 histidyl-tRNA synthetase, putative [Babesia ovata]
MLLCIGAPEVFQLQPYPRDAAVDTGVAKSPSAEQAGFARQLTARYSAPDASSEAVIGVCASNCNQYLFVLTSRVLHVYNNFEPNIHVGHLALSKEWYARYGSFCGMQMVPGLRTLCLLLERRDRVLVCAYDAQLGLEGSNGSDYGRHGTSSSHGTPLNGRSTPMSAPSLPGSPLRVPPRIVVDASLRRKSSQETTSIKQLRAQYDKALTPIRIKPLLVLTLPSPVSDVTFAEGQMYFWTTEQPGMYVTLSPEGFVNYLACRTADDEPGEVSLELHGTNLVQDMAVNGTVSPSHGLCYLAFGDSLYAKIDDATQGPADLEVLYNTTGAPISSLVHWVTMTCFRQGTGLLPPEFALNRFSADSLLNDLENSVLPGKYTLDELIDDVKFRQVIMARNSNSCLIVTESGALVALHIARVKSDHIGQLVYREGVERVAAVGSNVVIHVNGEIVVASWTDSGIKEHWSYKLENVRGLAAHNDVIVALYNTDGFVCFNTLGAILAHRRSRTKCAAPMSACVAAQGLALIATGDSSFIKYRLYNTGYNEMHCSNPKNNSMAFVGESDILIFHTRALEGTYGIPSKVLAEDRNNHAYDNNDLLGDLDCTLHAVSLSALDTGIGGWPLMHVAPNPSGSCLLCSTPNASAIYDGEWRWFGDDLGPTIATGWINDNICFVVVKLTMPFVIANRTFESVDSSGDYIDIGGWGTSYCHFYHVDDLTKAIEVLPIRTSPLSCTVYGETLYVVDDANIIAGYHLRYDTGSYKFDEVLRARIKGKAQGNIRELHCLEENHFALLDDRGIVYRVLKGELTRVIDQCSSITSATHVSGAAEKVVLLCSLRFREQVVMVTADRVVVIEAQITPAALVNEGVVAYLLNAFDADDSVQKVRIAKLMLPIDDVDDALLSPFHIDLLDMMLTVATAAGAEVEPEFKERFAKLPGDVQRRLLARQSRKHYVKEDIEKLESAFGCSIASVFEGMLSSKRVAEASFMLLALQSVTDPLTVRNTYNVKLLHMLAKEFSTQKTKDNLTQLFNSLLSFQNHVENVQGLNVRELVKALFSECNFMGVYKLCQLLIVEPSSLIQSMREELADMFVWGICRPQCRDMQLVGRQRRQTGVTAAENADMKHDTTEDGNEDQEASEPIYPEHTEAEYEDVSRVKIEGLSIESSDLHSTEVDSDDMQQDDDHTTDTAHVKIISCAKEAPSFAACAQDTDQPVDREERSSHTAAESGSKHVVDVAQMVVALQAHLSLLGEREEARVSDAHIKARNDIMREQRKIPVKVSPYAGTTMCSYFYDVFIAQNLFVPAIAIAIACRNFVAVSQVILKDPEARHVVRHVLTHDCSCSRCGSKFNLIKHCLLEAKRRFTQ